MTRRKFFEAMGWAGASLGAVVVTNEVSSSLTSLNPILGVLSLAASYDAPQSPVRWTDWLEGKATKTPRIKQIADGVAESILRDRPDSLSDLYHRVDEMDLTDLDQPHNFAHLAIAYLGWFGPHDVQNSFPNYIPGLRRGAQSDGGIHASSNAALANELSREANGNGWGRLNFRNFVSGVNLMDGIIGTRNLAIMEEKFMSGEYGSRVRLKVEGLSGTDAEVANVVIGMGRAFEAITTQLPGEREITEPELIDLHSHEWYADRISNGGRGVDTFFNQVMAEKPRMEINSGALDLEVLDDMLADMEGMEGIRTAYFDRQGIRGKMGTAFHLIDRPFDDWSKKAGQFKRYPLPETVDAIVVHGNRIGWREGARVYFS